MNTRPLQVYYFDRAVEFQNPAVRVIKTLKDLDTDELTQAIESGAIDAVALIGHQVCTGWRVAVNREVNFHWPPTMLQAAQRIQGI